MFFTLFQCGKVCGLSMESRVAYCASEDGKLHKEEMCTGKRRPDLEKKCPNHSHCKAMWHASEWSEVFIALFIRICVFFICCEIPLKRLFIIIISITGGG